MTTKKTFELGTPDEMITEVLGRFTVLDLREMSDDDLDRGEDRLCKAGNLITIREQGETNMIRWWKIESDGKQYEVRRFENFCFCSCYDFFFKRTVCKHVVLTTRFFCKRCKKREVRFGQLCDNCKMDKAPYLKNTTSQSSEKIGNVRI